MCSNITTSSSAGRGAAVADSVRSRGIRALLLTAIIVVTSTRSLLGGEPAANDQFAVVSTRGLTPSASCADLDNPPLRAWVADERGCLHSVPFELLVGADERPLVIYVHGNRMPHGDAVAQGWEIYRRIQACRPSGTPIRWIVWSWPSERDGVFLHDVRSKAVRTEAQGLYLALGLRQLVGPARLNLIGYSFGARIATGALHALAGGRLSGRTLPGESLQGLDVGVSLLAPAMDADWVHPGRYHGLAGSNMQHLTVLYNTADPALRAYWLVDGDRRIPAMGYAGLHGIPHRADGAPVPVWTRDCHRSVGPRHDEDRYYDPPCNAAGILARDIWLH